MKVSDDWFAVVAPDDGPDPDWTYNFVPDGPDWAISAQESVGAAVILHFTRAS